jgi:ketosteroid isomerase-like protein
VDYSRPVSPPANADLVRRHWEAWDAGDRDAVAALWHPELVWDVAALEGWDGASVFHGRDEALRFLGAWGERAAPAQTVVGHDDRVLASVFRDGTRSEDESAVVHTLRDGLFVRMESITDRCAAQRALAGTDPLAVVQTTWATWEALDVDRVVACFSDDVVYDLSHYPAWPGQARYVGPTSMTQFLAEWMSWWQGYRQEPIGWEVDGGQVLVVLRHYGIREGKHHEEVGALVYGVRPDGEISGWTGFASADEARAWMRRSG